MGKRMRLPNGFGQISKIKDRPLRQPWRAMVTTGWSDDGKPRRMSIGYFASYNEAYAALIEYHKSPYDKASNITLEELYNMWSTEHYPKLKTAYNYIAAWKRCDKIKNITLRQLTRPLLKETIEAPMPPSVHAGVKMLLTLMLDYALGLGMINENPVRHLPVNITPTETKHHIRFSNNEIAKIEKEGSVAADMILFGCYSGMRPGEICNIKKSDVNTNEWYLTGGSKTKAGKNRIVPLHSKIRNIISRYMEEGGELLFGTAYPTYKNNFATLMTDLGLTGHLPHDTRVTFVSKAKEAGCDEYIIKKIIGHRIDDMTERIYTSRSIKDICSEIEKIS